MKILSWNVNGIRAVAKKGFLEWASKCDCDILCLQETKAELSQFPAELTSHEIFTSFQSDSAEKKGYSGTATFFKDSKLNHTSTKGMGVEKYDTEGRIIRTQTDDFILYNIYFPNGSRDNSRLEFKLGFYESLLEKLKKEIATGEKVIVCGDFNTAHREIDLARPKNNIKNSGFLPIERQWLSTYLESGFIDSFRKINGDIEGAYSWWDYRFKSRDRNVGWRIDYFYISENLLPHLKDAFILSEVTGSDHCPVGIELEF
ncbi:MAG: exodeoxyribonuclease III [Deltaproteobacteria bacterium]|nr:exodeoxyribonuclease III [Deltaproteobacteria bacterium]